jgi:hypothetical protein
VLLDYGTAKDSDATVGCARNGRRLLRGGRRLVGSVSSVGEPDLVFFARDVNDARTIHHVGMYVGAGLMVHAPPTGWHRRELGVDRAFGVFVVILNASFASSAGIGD